MKKLFLTIILAAIALAGMSQNIGEAFYIYRNDGQFNAFFRDEVQSIEYSYEDADGVVYDEIVTQIVTTADSVYKIPLAAIDSIGFVQPETIYAENVKVIDNLMPYIKGVDGMVLTLSSEIPKDITPNINDVLLYENFDNSLFPFGFAGKVTTINNNTITCDEVTIDDIYQKLIGIGSMETLDDGQSVALRIHSRRVSGGTTASVKLSLPYGSEEEGFYGKLEGLLSFGIHVIYQHERGKSDYINVNLSPHIGIALEAGIKGKLIDWKWASKEIDLFYVPIPSTPFLLMITGTPVISASLEASITARRELSWGCDLGFSYENGKWSKFFKNKVGDPRDLELQGNVKGRFFIGPKIGFGVYSVGKVLATSIKNEIGAEFVADNGTDFLNTDNYEELSKKQVDCNLTGKFSLDAELKFAKVIKLEKEWEIASFTKNLNSWKLFPTFSTPTLDGSNSNNITVSTVPSEKLLWPVSIGLSLWKDNSLQDISYCTENYRTIESWPLQKYQTSFYNIKPNTEYIVSPLVKINGVEFRATPDATVYIKKDIPISIISFNINEATYSLNGYEHEGSHYTFRYIAETSVRLNNTENVEDWGYVYEDPDHEIKHISLKGKESPYTDTNYAFYRNEPIATATLYGYVKYIGDDNYYYGEKKDYDLIYDKQPKAETLDPTEVDETSAKVKCAYHEAAPWGGTCGIEYWEDTNVKDAKRIYFETASDEIEIPINLLKPNTVYYYQALIKVDKKYVGLAGIEKEDVYSDEIKTFTTKPHVVISSSDAINVKTTSATLTGTVEGYDPADESIKFAFMYSNESDLANSSNGVTVPAQYDGNGNLTAEISGLSDYTTYYYALAIKRGDAAYETSEVKSFKTLPVVTTLDNATTTYNSATLQGTCSKGITTAGFAIKKDGDSESTTFSASADANGNFSTTIDGLDANTTYNYYAFIQVDGKTYNGTELSFTTNEIQLCPDDNHPHMIDLGLPSGTKWACCNIGASKPEDYGSYYAWGETMPKSNFTWQTYQYGRSAEDVDYIGSDIAGTSYDAAFVALGDDYQTPSMELCKELINSTESKWITTNGVQGRVFTGTNGASIFLPAVGCRIREEIRYVGESGHYWTSTYHNTEPRLARGMTVSTNGASYQAGGGRFNGHPVRPVLPGITVKTFDATEVNTTSAILNGTVKNYAKSKENVKLAFVYSTSEDILNSADGKTIVVNHTGDGNMSVEISDLTDYTTYYYAAAYKLGNADYVLGEVKSFKTLPVVTTLGDPSVTVNSATLQGSCSKGVMTTGFAIKKDGNSESTTFSASADANGNFSTTIDGLDANTTYKYYAFIQADGQTYNGTELSFTTDEIQLCPDDNHPHMIDLGLPSGTKWACCNVGASKPEEYGGYYSWGEVSEKSYYGYEEYQTNEAIAEDESWRGKSIHNTSKDVAHVNWYSPWHIPTLQQMNELINNCDCEGYYVYKGVVGAIYKGRNNNNSIFMPYSGRRTENLLVNEKGMGWYWTSQHTENYLSAYFLHLYLNTIHQTGIYDGLNVRAVVD